MKAFRGPKVWLWRWRRNPLKRRADVVEAWVVLGACLLTVLAGVLAGLAAAGSVEDGLARERAAWRPAVARVVAQVPGSSSAHSHKASPGERIWTEVRWTVPDGSAHTGQVRVEPGSKPGTPVTVWTDPQGHLVSRPTTASEAAFRATLTGLLVGVSAAAVPFVAGLAVRTRLERRRMDAWDTEWSRLGPQWGRMV
ncbi:Rv1733c family protein [Streptomyces cyanogenus]|uniref:Membrane protein n=1 Tax=Streptomyces cyanogenus TaxID=80860 RepID=A0ABX7TM16_STRCY|nr:putative membrane protein [Streptomyces cyanogenus]